MNNVNIQNKKERKILIGILIFFLIIIWLLIYGGRYFGDGKSFDRRNENEIAQYLQEYIKNEYNVNSNVIYKYKEEYSTCTFSLDNSCFHKIYPKNTYEYHYEATDELKRKFDITFVNSYYRHNEYYEEKIKENLKKAIEKEKAAAAAKNVEKILIENYEHVKFYSNLEGLNYFYHIIIYLDDLSYDNIMKVKKMVDNNILSEYRNQYSIAFTNSLDDYSALLEKSYRYKTQYGWSTGDQYMGYDYIGKYSLESSSDKINERTRFALLLYGYSSYDLFIYEQSIDK